MHPGQRRLDRGHRQRLGARRQLAGLHPSNDTVGAIRNLAPGPGDVAYVNGNAVRDCVIYPNDTAAAGCLRIEANFAKEFRVAGTYYSHGYNFTGFGSYINHDVVLRTTGKMQFSQETVMLRGNIKKDAVDTDVGKIFLVHDAKLTLVERTTNVTFDVQTFISAGDGVAPMGGATRPYEAGTLEIKVGNADVDFDQGQIQINAHAKMTVMATDGVVRKIKNANLTEGLCNYGTTEILTGSKDVTFVMPARNNGGVFRVYDDATVSFGVPDPIWGGCLFVSLNGGVVSLGHHATMGGPSRMRIIGSTLEMYYSGATTSIQANLIGDVIVEQGSSIKANPDDGYGRFTAWSWYVSDSTFYANASSTIAGSVSQLYGGRIDFTNSRVEVHFEGTGAALAPGATWDVLYSHNDDVKADSNQPAVVDVAAPPGAVWAWALRDVDQAAGDDVFSLCLAELLPPPSEEPPAPSP